MTQQELLQILMGQNSDEENSDEDEGAHFQGEHVHDVGTSNTSSRNTKFIDGTSNSDGTSNTNGTLNTDGTLNIDGTSNTDGTSNADDITHTDESSENNIENTLSGEASMETQENSFVDTTDVGGASSSRKNLPPIRKWTEDHTLELIIGNTEAGVLTRRATQNECLFYNFLS